MQNGVSQNWKLCWSEGCFKPGTNYAVQDPPAPRLSAKAVVTVTTGTCSALPSLGSLGGDAFLVALAAKLNFLRDRVDNAACNTGEPDPMDTLVRGQGRVHTACLGRRATRHWFPQHSMIRARVLPYHVLSCKSPQLPTPAASQVLPPVPVDATGTFKPECSCLKLQDILNSLNAAMADTGSSPYEEEASPALPLVSFLHVAAR